MTPGLDQLPPLRDVIRAHGLGANRTLGQNYLLDLNLTGRIARAAGDLVGHTVLEIGPGPGGLTRALLAAGADKVVAVERDRRFIPALRQIAAHCPGRLDIVEGDALGVDQAALVAGPTRIVANLPYNVATPLLIAWLRTGTAPSWWASMTLLFQKEVAQRIVARPGESHYGRLSVICALYSQPRIAFDIAARAFTPPPKVTSTLVHFEPRPEADHALMESVEAVTRAAFGQRRKMLRSSLRPLFEHPVPVLEQLGLDPGQRAETVTVEQYAALARQLARRPAAPPAGR